MATSGPSGEMRERMAHYEDLAGGNPAAGFEPREKTMHELIADKASMEEQIRLLKLRFTELEDLLVSARAIAQRRGAETAWERFDERLANAGIGCVTAKVFKVLPSDTE
jgi:hypothetical protein